MKLRISCPNCHEEDSNHIFNFVNVEINDDGVYNIKCNKGHRSIVLTHQPKFEILFDLGAMALLDGYPKEAVSSFAASLERFYEFCIEVILNSKGINYEQYLDTWKLVANQSERQLGAFYFLYLNEFGEVPIPFSNKQTAFRNKVIHKGYIPKYDEVVEYASSILEYIYSIGNNIRPKCNETLKRTVLRKTINFAEKMLESYTIVLKSIPTIIRIYSDDNFGKKKFNEALSELKAYLESDFRLYTKK